MTDESFVPAVPLPGVDPEQYPYEFFPYLYEDYVPRVPESDPTPEPTPDPAPEPVQGPVISVDELLELFQEAQAPAEEQPAAALDPGNVVAVELDPGALAVVDAVKGVKSELVLISDQLAEVQLAMDRPLFTTPFEDYTVTEGLLLLLLLSAFLSVCYKLLRGGFQWLRS